MQCNSVPGVITFMHHGHCAWMLYANLYVKYHLFFKQNMPVVVEDYIPPVDNEVDIVTISNLLPIGGDGCLLVSG